MNEITQDTFQELIDDITNIYRLHFFNDVDNIKMLSHLNKLRRLRMQHGKNHPSLPSLLDLIGNILEESNLPQFSILIFEEQLRIEKYYLGTQCNDLAITLNKIGETYIKIDKLKEAEECFSQVFLILKNNNTKGRLYALAMNNAGLVKYYSASHTEAQEMFKLAIKELRVALGDFHLDVAELCLNVADLQLELGNLNVAMDNYLEALMILRLIHGNNHYKVCMTLHKIGFIHKVKDELNESLNAFYQALDVMRNLEDENASKILILYEIGLVNQCMGDINNALKVFEEIIEILKLKLGVNHIAIASVLGQLVNMCVEHGMTECSKAASKEMQCIFSNVSVEKDNDEYADTVIKIFGYAADNFHQCAAAA